MKQTTISLALFASFAGLAGAQNLPAPDGMVFYTGNQFPASYRGGAFIAFHGSWNRAPLPQAGFRVVLCRSGSTVRWDRS